MALTKGTKVFLGFVLLVCCWLSNASLHVADGPAESDGSKVLGPVVLDLKVAIYQSRFPAGKADLSDHLRTGLPIKLPKDDALQGVICAGKAAVLLTVLVCLFGFRCSSLEGRRTESLEPGTRVGTDAQHFAKPAGCDLEMGLAPTPGSDESRVEPELFDECWGEDEEFAEEEGEEEEGEEERISNDHRDRLILQAATMGPCVRRDDAPEIHDEAGRIALARLDKKSGEQAMMDGSKAAGGNVGDLRPSSSREYLALLQLEIEALQKYVPDERPSEETQLKAARLNALQRVLHERAARMAPAQAQVESLAAWGFASEKELAAAPCLLRLHGDPMLTGCLAYVVSGGSRVLGSASDIYLKGLGIRPQHCQISEHSGGLWLTNLCSQRHRLFVNGRSMDGTTTERGRAEWEQRLSNK
ncbi:unnamed protein product, partial [Cladocopium goreaui]